MPETPSPSARAAKRISVSAIASRAPSTRSGWARRAGARGAPRAVAREAARERERREERRDHGCVADAAVEAHADDGLELLDVARRRGRVEGADLVPVAGLSHGAGGARAVAVRRHLLGLDAPPGLDGRSAAARGLDEVRAVALGEAERRPGQARGRAGGR